MNSGLSVEEYRGLSDEEKDKYYLFMNPNGSVNEVRKITKKARICPYTQRLIIYNSNL